MSRYIDADALIMKLDEKAQIPTAVVSAIISAPSIDIVYCKECRHWQYIKWADKHICLSGTTSFKENPDGFCSSGEREGE